MIAVFDTYDFLRQFKPGDVAGYRERIFSDVQLQEILAQGIVMYDSQNIPNYLYDETATEAIAIGDGYIRLATEAEKAARNDPIPPELPAIFADVVVTDLVDASDVPRLQNDGEDYVQVVAKLRNTKSTADDSNVITLIDGVSWNIQLREATETNHDVITSHPTDPIYDVFEATFTEGVCSFNYTTTNKPAVVYMREADFAILTLPDGQGGTQNFRVELINPVVVKVYRVLSSI